MGDPVAQAPESKPLHLTTLQITAVDASKSEGNAGPTTFTFHAARTGDTTASTTVGWSVAGIGADAASAADFMGGILPFGSLTFAAGETGKDSTINVTGDLEAEANEAFTVVLATPDSPAVIAAGGGASGTIVTDDTAFAISADTASAAEGDAGATVFTFTVNRSGDLSGAQSLDWVVTGSGDNPVNATDFTGGVLPSGMISFAVGETAKTITVNVVGDATYEAGETFTVTLSNPSGGIITTASASSTVANDDTAPTLQVAAVDVSRAEGDSGSTAFTFRITRSGDSSGDATVDWAVAGAGTNAASAADFFGGTLPSGLVSFAVGDTVKDITVSVTGDTTVEADEEFAVALSNASGATITTASASSTISNDDSGPSSPIISGTAGDDGDDVVESGAGYDYLVGGAGEDQLDGGPGDNRLDGGAGNDVLNGAAGADTLVGGAGNDYIDGGAGIDTVVFRPGDGYDYVGDFTAGAGGDVIDLRMWTAIHSLADLQPYQDANGGNAAIDFQNGDGLTLAGVAVSSLTASNFLFAA